MKTTVDVALGLLLLCGFLSVSGCQEGTSSPATYPVTGKVTMNGEAVADARVTFIAGQGGQGATGVTNAAGVYELATFKKGDGALPGRYTITVMKYKVEASASGGGASGDEYPADYDPEASAAAGTASENLLPAKYADPAASGLTAEVGTAPLTKDIELTP